MKVYIHDFSGHPFQVQLSRELARRGHQVTHGYSEDIVGARGSLAVGEHDPASLTIRGLSIGHDINRYNFIRRFADETRYGSVVRRDLAAEKPDVAVFSNMPIDSLASAHRQCLKLGIPVVFWVQDLLGAAASSILGAKLGKVGSIIGGHYSNREAQLLRTSDAVITISEDFVAPIESMGVDRARVHVIPNWAPLDEMPQLPKNQSWLETHGLAGHRLAIYSGALGLKHNPGLLLDLAKEIDRRGIDARVVVISEGYGADWLKKRLEAGETHSLQLQPFLPFDQLPGVLACADLLLAILEPEAGEFCVPSKVLTYMCVGRPILLAAASNNLASRTLVQYNCGSVVDPSDSAGFVEAAVALLSDQSRALEMGAEARRYAEGNFDIEKIAGRFESIFHECVGRI